MNVRISLQNAEQFLPVLGKAAGIQTGQQCLLKASPIRKVFQKNISIAQSVEPAFQTVLDPLLVVNPFANGLLQPFK